MKKRHEKRKETRIERLTDQKYDKYPELVHSDRVHYVVLACEEGGRWGPDAFKVVEDLVKLKVAPLHSLLRRSAALAYTRRWWAILAMGAQSAAVDCILGRDLRCGCRTKRRRWRRSSRGRTSRRNRLGCGEGSC